MAQPSNPLLANMSDSQTFLLTVGHTFFANGGVCQIESEKIKYTQATDSQLLGLTRGYDGTTAAAHLKGELISDLGALVANPATPRSESPMLSLTTVERDDLVSPHEGDMIYNSTTDKLNVYADGAWEEITSA